MKARDAISLINKTSTEKAQMPSVEADMHLLQTLPKFFESPNRELKVVDNGEEIGMIDSYSMLEALSRQIASRHDCSIIEVECSPADYSASILAHAIEDTDAHLVDLLTSPSEEGKINVTLRIRCESPTAAVNSLERYGFNVTNVSGLENPEFYPSLERLLALRALINI